MAHIKCRYFKAFCQVAKWYSSDCERKWSEYWWCDDDSQCSIGQYKKPENCGYVVNPRCSHAFTKDYEFEGNYKRYKYSDESGLEISGKSIPYFHIKYLEIDGRILIELEGGDNLGRDNSD